VYLTDHSTYPLKLTHPTATLHSPTHALLLASKSNYQNLLEGNHLPGVSYPDSLSTGLTSKRTSHKVAEQGRRNRINEALKEMQALLPSSSCSPSTRGSSGSKGGKDTSASDENSPEAGGGGDGADGGGAGDNSNSKESKEDAAAKSSSSKAATVESANVYIKQMQLRDAEKEALIARLRDENAEMRRRFEAERAGGGGGGGTETGDEVEIHGTTVGAIDSASPAEIKVQ